MKYYVSLIWFWSFFVYIISTDNGDMLVIISLKVDDNIHPPRYIYFGLPLCMYSMKMRVWLYKVIDLNYAYTKPISHKFKVCVIIYKVLWGEICRPVSLEGEMIVCRWAFKQIGSKNSLIYGLDRLNDGQEKMTRPLRVFNLQIQKNRLQISDLLKYWTCYSSWL